MASCWEICEQGWRKGPWTPQEDKMLIEYVSQNGEGRWSSVSKCTDLNRSGKSCRLRWVNYLRPGLKKGHLTPQEEGIIIELHALWGNKWSTIARYLPGRTDNEIKNYWRTHFKKRSSSAAAAAAAAANPNNNSNKKRRLDMFQTQKEENYDNINNDNQESEILFSSKLDNHDHHELILQPVDYDQDNLSWFDYNFPVDYCMWDGLWNLQDNSNCTKMGVENQANYVGINGGYIF